MDFDIDDLVSSAVGAISEVADDAYDAVTSLFDGSDSDDSGTYSDDSSDSGDDSDGAYSEDDSDDSGDDSGGADSEDDSDDSGDDSDGADSDWDDSGLDYNSIESLFGGVPISADIDEDGGFDIGDVEEFCEDKFKVLVGAFIGSEELQEQSDEMTQEGIDQLGNDITQGADDIWNDYVYGEELQEQADQMTQEAAGNAQSKAEWKYQSMEDYIYGDDQSDAKIKVLGNAIDTDAEYKISVYDDGKIDPQVKVGGEAKYSGIQVQGEDEVGDNKLGGGLDGKAGLMNGDVEAYAKVGKDELDGKWNSCIQGKAMASVAEGSVEGKIKICNIEIDAQGTGYALGAGAKFEGGIVDGKFKIGADVCAIFGIGGSISIGLAGPDKK